MDVFSLISVSLEYFCTVGNGIFWWIKFRLSYVRTMFCFAREKRARAISLTCFLVYNISYSFWMSRDIYLKVHERPCVSDFPGWNLEMQCHRTTLATRPEVLPPVSDSSHIFGLARHMRARYIIMDTWSWQAFEFLHLLSINSPKIIKDEK